MDIKETNFSWTRFWVPLGQPIHMGFNAQGFLTDPEDDFGRHYNPDLRTLDELSGRQFLVLCGEPASGKSTVVKNFVEKRAENSDCLFVVFREILSERDLRSSIDESPLWKSWVNSDKNLLLVIDGVDEGVIKIGNFLPVLVKIVRTLAPEIRNRLSLFLVCRTLDWEQHVTRQNELAGLLLPANGQGIHVAYTLCPLRIRDAELAARQLNLDSDRFMNAVGANDLRSLAAYPFTLKMLLFEFQRGQLHSKTRREFYEQFARQLCTEAHDAERRLSYGRLGPQIPPPERLMLAAECPKSVILGVSLRIMPALVWDRLWPLLESEGEISKQIIWNAAGIEEDTEKKHPFVGLHASQLASLYLLSVKLYPLADDPPFVNGFQERYSRRKVSDFRRQVADALTNLGDDNACRELWRIAHELPEVRPGMLRRYHQARQNYRSSQWDRPPPAQVIALMGSQAARLVRNSRDLLEVVIESLGRLNKRIVGSTNPRLLEFWDIGGTPQKPIIRGPRSEEFMVQQVAAWLQDDLSAAKGCVIGREVVPRPGQKTDISIEAPSLYGGHAQIPKVVVEVKGNWNHEVKTALKDQLVDRYLVHQQDAVGLYLVIWVGPGVIGAEQNKRNKLESDTAVDAEREVNGLANRYDGRQEPYLVQGFVLNCELSS